MSVIIRLQNLPWSANALDIRQFFNGLGIPEGGVHIVGGELGDAFIAFSTDEDARQAFNRNGGKIKEVQIKLMLSSRTEMQKVIEAARNPLAAFMQTAAAVTQPLAPLLPAAIPAIVPEMKTDDSKNDKRDRRRSRSRSRDRKDRSRDRDRRDTRRGRRDRSRSRSREYRDRHRRDRSHSRDRRSNDRDRRSRDRRRSEDRSSPNSNNGSNPSRNQPTVGVWEDPIPNLQAASSLLGNMFPHNLDEARRNLTSYNASMLMNNRNGFPNDFNMTRGRDSWPPNVPGNGFCRQNNRGFQGVGMDMARNFNMNPNFGENSRMMFNRSMQDSPNSRFGPPVEKVPLLERPFPLEATKNSCVQLRPFYGGYGEIRRFFQGIFINNTGIKFVNDEFGKRTGIVYIRFALAAGKEEALSRSGGMLKNQTVEVSHLDDEVFDSTLDRFLPENGDKDDNPDFNQRSSLNFSPNQDFACLLIEDLSTFVKEQDILKLFSEYTLSSIIIGNKNRRPAAYVKFTNPEDAKLAQTEKIKHVIDGKPVTVSPCTNDEFDSVTDLLDRDNPKDTKVTSDCISLTGLPLKTTDRDITDFFSDIAIVPQKVHLVTSNTGFTGEAFCEFASLEDAEVALEKDGIPLGSGTVTVKSTPRAEMEAAIGISPTPRIQSHPPLLGPNPSNIRPFFPRPFGFGSRGGPGLMGHRPPLKRYPHPNMAHDTGDVGVPGCTVLMENVPYKAGLDEILEFFDGYDIPADNVLRRYNENGTPSGEAKVIFSTPKDAIQALEDKQHHKIRDRTIYLSMC